MNDDHGHGQLQKTLDLVLVEARATNGRVRALEGWQHSTDVVLFGDQRGGGIGLVQQSRSVDDMLTEWRALKKALIAVAGSVLTVGGGWLLHALTSSGAL